MHGFLKKILDQKVIAKDKRWMLHLILTQLYRDKDRIPSLQWAKEFVCCLVKPHVIACGDQYIQLITAQLKLGDWFKGRSFKCVSYVLLMGLEALWGRKKKRKKNQGRHFNGLHVLPAITSPFVIFAFSQGFTGPRWKMFKSEAARQTGVVWIM